MRIFFCSLVFCLWIANALAVDIELSVENPDILLAGIARAENPAFDSHKVGDRELTHKAYGVLQIRQPYLDDVNRIVGSNLMREIWGKPVLTVDDMKDPEKAAWTAKVYLVHFGKRYEQITGKKPTNEVYARIHNGGPNGWQRNCTLRYWAKVERQMIEAYSAIMARRNENRT